MIRFGNEKSILNELYNAVVLFPLQQKLVGSVGKSELIFCLFQSLTLIGDAAKNFNEFNSLALLCMPFGPTEKKPKSL